MTKDERNAVIKEWWEKLQENKGGRAKLRRCCSPAETALLPETHNLYRRLPNWISFEAVSSISGLSAHIKERGSLGFGPALATPFKGNDRPPLSENRFKQLLSSRNWDDLYQSLRRSLSILQGKANLPSLTEIILLWDQEFREIYQKPGRGVKFILTQDYYRALLKKNQIKGD